MSIQETPIRIVDSATYHTANRAALRSVTEALRGGDNVDHYFRLRAQSGKLLNAILNGGGFHQVAQPGLYHGQEGYFYHQGNSAVLVSYGVEEGIFDATLWEAKEFSAFVAFQVGKSGGEVIHLRLKVDANTSGPLGSVKWKDLGDLILRTIGQSLAGAYGASVELLKRGHFNGSTAEKLLGRAGMGVEVALDQQAEKVTANGNRVAFTMAGSERPSLAAIAVAGSGTAANSSLGTLLEGISHNLIIQNFTDKPISVKVSHNLKEGSLVAAPDRAYSGATIPACVDSGDETSIGTIADRHLCGEAFFLWKNTEQGGNLGYSVEVTLGDNSTRVVAGFDLPYGAANSSFIKFNPAGAPADVFNTHKGKSAHLSEELSLNDYGVTLASNSHTGETPEFRSGKEGKFFRSILAIYDKTNPPKSWGNSPLDGLFFGSKYTER